jgi:hypothetical protein
MDMMDPSISPQVLPVVDEVLPKFESMQMEIHGEHHYLFGLMFGETAAI